MHFHAIPVFPGTLDLLSLFMIAVCHAQRLTGYQHCPFSLVDAVKRFGATNMGPSIRPTYFAPLVPIPVSTVQFPPAWIAGLRHSKIQLQYMLMDLLCRQAPPALSLPQIHLHVLHSEDALRAGYAPSQEQVLEVLEDATLQGRQLFTCGKGNVWTLSLIHI